MTSHEFFASFLRLFIFPIGKLKMKYIISKNPSCSRILKKGLSTRTTKKGDVDNSASLPVLGTLGTLSFLILLTAHLLDGETVVQRDHCFPDITEQLVFVFFPSYHDLSQ